MNTSAERALSPTPATEDAKLLAIEEAITLACEEYADTSQSTPVASELIEGDDLKEEHSEDTVQGKEDTQKTDTVEPEKKENAVDELPIEEPLPKEPEDEKAPPKRKGVKMNGKKSKKAKQVEAESAASAEEIKVAEE